MLVLRVASLRWDLRLTKGSSLKKYQERAYNRDGIDGAL